ncbi:MAG: hypothetical protein II752_08185 [Muribaculaceae bacterium]|nr:hypothetical protein [Muribaculaceae bacterium]
MKILNDNAPEHLVKKLAQLDIHSFIMDVIQPLEIKYYELLCPLQLMRSRNNFRKLPIWKFEDACYENVAVLLHTIPIFLRKKKDDEKDKDLLGAYYSGKKGNSPYIKLYLTDIYDASKKDDKYFKWLFTKVLIHELAHAALDIFNWEHNDIKREKVTYRSKYGKWREESMANAIALRIIRDSSKKDFYNYAKKFMRSQPDEYALGVLMENFGYWDFRSVFDSKIYGVKPALRNQWLKYVNNNPDWKGLHDWNNKILENLVK